MRQALLAAFLSLWLFPVAGWPQALGYTYVTLTEPNSEWTVMRGLNESAEIVGEAGIDYSSTPFLLKGSAYTPVNPDPSNPNGTSVFKIFSVNKKRQMVGTVFDAFGFFLENGQITYLRHPKYGDALAHSVIAKNNTEVLIAGWLSKEGRATAYYHTLGKSWVLIHPKGASESWAYGVTGQNGLLVSGTYEDDTLMRHGFLYSAKTKRFKKIAPPGATESYAWGLNDQGHVVGSYWSASTPTGGSFLWDGKNYWPIAVPGASSTNAYDVNNKGQVVGTYSAQLGPDQYQVRGFLATPIR
jgi:hypothetical protein